MRRLSLFLAIMMIFLGGCSERKGVHEQVYRDRLCAELGGVTEYRCSDASRVDCLTREYAIEVDFAKKWAESVGQALHYASMTGRKPAIALIVRDTAKDRRRLWRVRRLAERYGIRLYTIERED